MNKLNLVWFGYLYKPFCYCPSCAKNYKVVKNWLKIMSVLNRDTLCTCLTNQQEIEFETSFHVLLCFKHKVFLFETFRICVTIWSSFRNTYFPGKRNYQDTIFNSNSHGRTDPEKQTRLIIVFRDPKANLVWLARYPILSYLLFYAVLAGFFSYNWIILC